LLAPDQCDALFRISDSEEWQERVCKILATYYDVSYSYDQADTRFQIAVPKYINLFNKEALTDLVKKINSNSQCYSRGRARQDYEVIKARIDELFGSEFDYDDYPAFKNKVDIT